MINTSFIWLSHTLSVETPVYGGGQGLVINPTSSISQGDNANTSSWSLPNHIGTHVDSPLHFFDDGMAVSDYSPEFWLFQNVQIMDIPCDNNQLIYPSDIVTPIDSKTELLLIRTGFENYRTESRYWQNNPGLHSELGKWIRSSFPNIRAVGIDTISISSRRHRAEGRIAHRAFLNTKDEGHPLILVEDMSLIKVSHYLTTVVIAPLLVKGSDGAPCTVIGFT